MANYQYSTNTTSQAYRKCIRQDNLTLLPPLHQPPMNELRHLDQPVINKDLGKVYTCASQITKTLLAGPSLINATENKHVCLPSIKELDSMIDNTGRVMQVLDEAKNAWLSTDGTPIVDMRHLKRHKVNNENMMKTKKSKPNQCHSCNSTETPEWRKGPLGPRTLCNACGLIWTKLCKQEEAEAEFKKCANAHQTKIIHGYVSPSSTLSQTSLNNNNNEIDDINYQNSKKHTLSFLLT